MSLVYLGSLLLGCDTLPLSNCYEPTRLLPLFTRQKGESQAGHGQNAGDNLSRKEQVLSRARPGKKFK
jgi:hypothetical protein